MGGTTGAGAGAAWADCDRLFNPARVPGTRLAVLPASAAPAPAAPTTEKQV